jgi:hypothetical protein
MPFMRRHIAPRSNFVRTAANRRRRAATKSIRENDTTLAALSCLGGCQYCHRRVVISLASRKRTTTTTTATAPVTATDFDPTLRGEQLAQLYPAVYEVASQFNCPCGDCYDGVEVCDCQMERGAAEVRSFIYQLLQIHKPPHVIELVAEKYGHRKNGLPESLNFEKLMPPSSSVPSKPEAAINNK